MLGGIAVVLIVVSGAFALIELEYLSRRERS
jgi:hypothetical protein